jgi:hypothetical protein
MTDPNVLARYSFLPWLRQGIANSIDAPPAADRQRASITIALDVVTDSGLTGQASQVVELIGPGDIIGVSRDAIVRHEPRHWVTDFEPNYLALIEFYDEDFPWRYSPAPPELAKHRLTPWLTLVALTEDEFEDAPLGGPLSAFETTVPAAQVFPAGAQLWAWAHVHADLDLTRDEAGVPLDTAESVARLEQVLASDGDLGHSRLLCPRKLEPNTGYHAFLIPTFETGRLAGLGEPIDPGVGALDIAWGAGQTRFPYYYRWYFRTSERGDFEFLVRRLQPRPVDPRVGIRNMDVSAPGGGVDGIDLGPGVPAVLGLEGALRSPETQSTPWPASYPDPFQQQLAALVNRAADYQDANPDGDPVITPPLYGRWHALRQRVALTEDTAGGNPYDPAAKWLTELNLDPRHRAVAGLGTRVVQQGQEALMHEAWRQVGEILEANRRLRIAQLAEVVSGAQMDKHVRPLRNDLKLTITQAVHRRVPSGGATAWRQMQLSRVPTTVVAGDLRKVIRPRGPVMKRMGKGARTLDDLLTQVDAGRLTATPPKTPPADMISLGTIAELVEGIDVIGEDALTPEAVKSLPLVPDFVLTSPESETRFTEGGKDSEEGERFKEALGDLHEVLVKAPPPPPPRPPLGVDALADVIMTTIDPRVAIRRRILVSIRLPDRLRPQTAERIVPVMAYPEFPQPMYQPLRDLSAEYLIPNIGLVPPNTISLLETNQKFIEAYFVGLNHEMGRELLWREYPTDQRGSYFRQFWDVGDFVPSVPGQSPEQQAARLKDIPEIHTWTSGSALGSHNHRDAQGDATQLVLLIRGDLLKRYPNAIIYAHRARWQTDGFGNPLTDEPRELVPINSESDQLANARHPLYSAKVEPDIHFLGFDLTVDEAKGVNADDPGWFFVLKERVGEARFGLDVVEDAASVELNEWDDLAWGHVAGDFGPGNHLQLPPVAEAIAPADPQGMAWHADSNAADVAFILFQDPVLVAVHAQEMLRS